MLFLVDVPVRLEGVGGRRFVLTYLGGDLGQLRDRNRLEREEVSMSVVKCAVKTRVRAVQTSRDIGAIGRTEVGVVPSTAIVSELGMQRWIDLDRQI